MLEQTSAFDRLPPKDSPPYDEHLRDKIEWAVHLRSKPQIPQQKEPLMPTGDQMDAVQRRIEELTEDRFLPDNDWMRPAADDRPGSVPWSDLSRDQQVGVLISEVMWSGFQESQIADVSTRVLDGEPPVEWMGDIVASAQWKHEKGLFAEIGEDQQAARVRDYGEADAATYPARMAEADRLIEASMVTMPEQPAMTEEEVERLWPANDNSLAAPERGTLLAETFRLNREIGYAGFRQQYFDDPDAIKEWPDPAEREKGLREAWDGEADFTAFLKRFEDFPTEGLAEFRDTLAVMQAGPRRDQVDHYNEVVDQGKAARDASPSYDQRLQEAADHGMSLPRDKDRGRDR